MSKIFGTLAAVLLAISAFVAWKNLKAKEFEINTTLDASIRLQASTEKSLKKQVKRFRDADNMRLEHIAAAEKEEEKLKMANEKYAAAKKALVALEAQHKQNEKELARADDILKELPNPKELVPKIKRMRAQLADATDGIASEEAKLANLVELDKSGKSRIKSVRQVIDYQSAGVSFPTLKTRISSIYRNWGFVILAAGDRNGVVADSVLDVVRGGEVVAKLKVTAVESGRASADIVLDSVAESVTLQAGDTVVAERKAVQATAAK